MTPILASYPSHLRFKQSYRLMCSHQMKSRQQFERHKRAADTNDPTIDLVSLTKHEASFYLVWLFI